MSIDSPVDSHRDLPKFTLGQVLGFIRRIIGPEKRYIWLTLIYGAAISLLTLALPISVQMLIDTVANTALVQPLITLSVVLLTLLLISGALTAWRTHVMELFGRRIYARLSQEISLRAVYAQGQYFDEQDRDELFNRYFDIMTLQKNVPSLLSGGFTIVLQSLIGIVVVSMYHPVFLAFNMVLLFVLFLILTVWGPGAVRTSLELSHAKYKGAHWLERMAAGHRSFKSEKRIIYALDKVDDLTANYINCSVRHFRNTFSQTIALLLVYAVASAALLGLGGWLVIQGQLSLGQLVAAELIMSAIFFGMSQFGTYLVMFYDICAASEELHQFYDVPLEKPSGTKSMPEEPIDMVLDTVIGETDAGPYTFNLSIPAGSQLAARAESHVTEELFTKLVRREVEPSSGWIRLGGVDIQDLDIHRLRERVVVIDRPMILECGIDKYMRLSSPDAGRAEMVKVLECVGLAEHVRRLPGSLETELTPRGWPLSVEETLKLKLAAALLAKPKVLMLSGLFDMIEAPDMRRALDWLRSSGDCTVIYFTRRGKELGLSDTLWLDRQEQRLSHLDERELVG